MEILLPSKKTINVNDEAIELFVPGRLCLFGEHSDWAGGYRTTHPDIEKGYTLICGTNQGLYASAKPHADLFLTVTLDDGTERGESISMTESALLAEAKRGRFWSYIAGTAYQVMQRYDVGGLAIHNYKTDLPVKKGLSSSAAVCVLTARAFSEVYGLGLTVQEEMELAYLGEITTPSLCGRMDQGCAFGSRPVLMTFDGDNLDVAPVRVGGEFHLFMVDLMAEKNTPKILADLNACYPDVDTLVARGLRDMLGKHNKQLIRTVSEALEAGDAQQLGALMVGAQALFDEFAQPACPEELTSPVLHELLNWSAIQPYVWGGKGVGSQGDGTAQFVARSVADRETAMGLIEAELGMRCLPLTIKSVDAE